MSPNGQEKNAGSQHLGMRGLLSLIFQSGTNTATQTYSAFISYNRSVDGRLAPALQSAIQKFAKPWFQLRGIRVFRDDSNLSANPDLWESVKRAIQQAEFFILLASPESGRSKWVAREVEYWLSRKSIEKLLLAVTESSEAGSQRPIEWPDVRALLPQTLAERYSTVPRFVDLRWAHHKDRLTLRDARFRECVADLAAPLHNRSKDELFGEDVRQHRRTVRLARATIALLGVLLIISTIAALVAAAQRQEALHQLDIATSRQLAAEADLKAATDPQLASLLSLAAFKIQTTAEAQTSIVHQLDRIRQIQGFLQPKTPGPINNIATSPDGKIVAASSDTSTTLWAVQSRVQLGVIESIGSLSFSPDSKVIAIGSQSAVGLWRTDNLLAMGSLPTGTAGPVLFGNDGNDVRTISIGTGNTTIATWGLSDGTQKSSVSVGESSGGSLDPTGSIALLDRITTVDLVNTRDGRQLASLPTPDMPFSYAFSADGHLLAVGGQLGTITIWNVTDRTIVRTLSGTKTAVNSVAFSDDNRTLAAGSADKQVVTWDLSTGVRRDTLSAHTGIVTGVAFLTGEGTLVSGGEDGKLVIWGPSADASRIPQRVLNGVPNLAAATPDGQFLVTSNESNTTLFDARTGLPVFTFSGSADDVAISPDGRLLATRGQNSKIILIWDLNDRQLLISLPSEGGIERSPLAFSPD